MLLHQRTGAEPVAVELAPRRGLQQHVGGGDQRAEPIAVGRLAQIEHDGALAAVVLPEEQRALGILAVLVEGPDTARGTAAGRLHLDDVGAQPGQGQPTVLGLLVGQLDDANAGERTPALGGVAGNGTLVLRCHVTLQSTPRCVSDRPRAYQLARRIYPVRPDEAGGLATPRALTGAIVAVDGGARRSEVALRVRGPSCRGWGTACLLYGRVRENPDTPAFSPAASRPEVCIVKGIDRPGLAGESAVTGSHEDLLGPR